MPVFLRPMVKSRASPGAIMTVPPWDRTISWAAQGGAAARVGIGQTETKTTIAKVRTAPKNIFGLLFSIRLNYIMLNPPPNPLKGA